VGAKNIIGWRDSDKPDRIVAVTQLFIKEGIETEAQLRDWLMVESSVRRDDFRVFLHISIGKYKYVGRNFPYHGPVVANRRTAQNDD
jgi:hypothetical protein